VPWSMAAAHFVVIVGVSSRMVSCDTSSYRHWSS
jgi:hypothetical protein